MFKNREGSVKSRSGALLAAPIRFYRYFVSPLLGPRCRFHPTCSAYMLSALEKYGAAKGLLLGIGRICRCHPWHRAPWHDPVPKRFTWRAIFGYKRRHKAQSSGRSEQRLSSARHEERSVVDLRERRSNAAELKRWKLQNGRRAAR